MAMAAMNMVSAEGFRGKAFILEDVRRGRIYTLQENPHCWVPTIKVRPSDGSFLHNRDAVASPLNSHSRSTHPFEEDGRPRHRGRHGLGDSQVHVRQLPVAEHALVYGVALGDALGEGGDEGAVERRAGLDPENEPFIVHAMRHQDADDCARVAALE